MASKKSTKVTVKTVLESALKSRVRRVVVIGVDSHGEQYVAASGNCNNVKALTATIEQIAAAAMFLRKIAKTFRRK